MTEIKTDIGYARAFVRLALERKLLHRHLATLLGNSRLLSELYKQYAFVRCEDEREQFLYHILSLNAAQFRCFTNTFTKTSKLTTGLKKANLLHMVGGSLCSSPQINLPANTPLFKFDHKNLGVLSTLRIGHASGSEKPPKWYLEYIIVRNEITGQMYRFPCGRWFGQGVEDSHCWLLNQYLRKIVQTQLSTRCRIPQPEVQDVVEFRPEVKLHSETAVLHKDAGMIQRLIEVVLSFYYDTQLYVILLLIVRAKIMTNSEARITEIEQVLGESVNSLVKYFYSEKHSKSELAHLLCGERGLVNAIEQV
ncbi:RUN domain protein [Teladorsagia circumcincta]|uniref:RUN domain protein n=1 Tax=Teladorsagia circumcincta TaxID=45464 RepID=A0A2G9UCP8_TELCI|nr:RUN domain protein [Teladorsagia circumcincta]